MLLGRDVAGRTALGREGGVEVITLAPGTASATANALVASLEPGSVTVVAGTATAQANALAATLDPGTVTLTPGTASAQANALAASLNIVTLIQAGTATATANALSATLSGEGTATISPGTARAQAAALAADLSGTGTATIDAGTATAQANALAAALEAGSVTIQAGTATATANALAASIAQQLLLRPGTATATAVALDPTLDGGVSGETIKGNEGIKFTPPSGSETTLALRYPLLIDPVHGVRKRRAALDSLDYSVRDVVTAPGKADEYEATLRFSDDPQRLLRVLETAMQGETISYLTDLTDSTTSREAWVIGLENVAEIEPETERGRPEWRVRVRLRAVNDGDFDDLM